MQSQLIESQLNDSVSVEPTDEHQGQVLELTEQGNPMRGQGLQCCTVGFMMINSLGGRTLAGFRLKLSRKWREVLHRDFRRFQSCCQRTDR